MTKFYKVLAAALMTVMMLPLWQSSELKAWEPSLKYAKWVNSFAIDKTWSFSNGEPSESFSSTVNDGTDAIPFPGTIAWSFMSWNAAWDSDDYDMHWIKVYLADANNHSRCIQLAEVQIDQSNSGDNNWVPGSIEDKNNCSSWCVQVRRYDYERYSYFVYMVTQYSDDVRKFIQECNGHLCIRVQTKWDYGHYKEYDEYSDALDSEDCQLITLSAPTVSNPEWVVKDGKTAVKYSRNVSTSNCSLGIYEYCNNTSYSYGYKSVNYGTETAWLYPFSDPGVSLRPTLGKMSEQPIKYEFYLSKTYTASRSNYTYHTKKTNAPDSKTIYSSSATLTPPAFAQPENFAVTNENDGTVTLNWNVRNTNGDQSDFIIERAYDADFSKSVTTERVKLVSGQTNYSFTDKYTERNQGSKDFYYRIRREHAAVKDLNATKKVSVNTDYTSVAKVDAEPTADGKHIKLTWELNNGIWDKNTMNQQVLCNGEVFASFTNNTTTTYTTTQSLPTCEPLMFSVRVMANGTVQDGVRAMPVTLPTDKIGIITDMKPSCGYFNNHVTVNWTTDANNNNFNYFHILRSEYGNEETAESLGTVNAVPGVTEYSFDDKSCVPGTYYIYSVRGYSECDGSVQMQTSKSDIGFAQPFGVVSGQITYSGNQGVKGTAVHAVGDGTRRGYSLYFKKDRHPELVITGAMLDAMTKYDPTGGQMEGTIEMYQKREGEATFHHVATTFKGTVYTTYIDGVQQPGTSRPVWFPSRYSNNKTNLKWYFKNDWKVAVLDEKDDTVNGFIDEIRIWNVCRDSAEIVKTMNCYLNGNEHGLTGYYRCDDNMPNHLFDISRTGNIFNAHHLTMKNVLFDESNIPTTEQLSLRGYTDENGHYLITNIPYSVSGTLYNVIPTLGVHEFNPSSRPLFFNGDATTHNSIDFTDVSSFPVSGYVYYEGTDYPVEGCNFYVDGNACTMDNTIIKSAADGSFTISVPIGDHYIEVRKANHTFVLGGRYPESVADKKTTVNFQQPVSNLIFYDNTLVTLTGRVAGGTVQDSLPHGMQLGKANIGQARVVISPETKAKYNLNIHNDLDRRWGYPDSCEVASNAYTYAKNGSRAMRIVIETDPMTGEFSALVPPIDMTVDSISVPSNPDIVFDLGSFAKLELSKAGDSYLQKDSALVDSESWRYFKYTAKLDAIFRVNPELIVTDTQHDNGMMGIRQQMVQDPANDTVYMVNVFEYDSLAKQWKYNFEVPCFLQGNTYLWHLRAFEQYVNRDEPDNPRCDTVPLNGSRVTLANQLAAAGDTSEVVLDSAGCAYYRFHAGDPLKTAPHRLGLTITYTDSEHSRSYDWEQNGKWQGVILGSISDGTNFITEGPDHVLYVLRDPPGGGSSATLRTGTTITNTTVSSSTGHWETETGILSHLGLKTTVAVGMGVMNISEMKAVDKLTTSAGYSGHTENVHTETATYTTTREISTESDIHHVGSGGDVYIGYSTNRTFGEATSIALLRDATGHFYLGTEPVITVGEQFKTDFTFSQLEIETAQIPNFIKLRDALLETVNATEYDNPPVNKGKDIRYITMLEKTAPDFGTIGTYKALAPEENMPADTIEQDMVLYYNCQIDAWKARLSDNERAKVGMLENNERKLIKNISIDGGATLTESVTTTSSDEKSSSVYHGFNVHIKNELGFQINGIGEEWLFETNDGGDWGNVEGSTETSETTTSYTFDLNPYEQLTVNIYDAGDGFSPVFATIGGQTACPYEDVEKTRYFEPGRHTLHVATQKMEDPLVRVDGASAFSAIPIGSEAFYTLQLSNQTVVTSPVIMSLRLMDESNPDGARLLIDDMPLDAAGMSFRFTGDHVITKTLVLRQGRPDILEYRNIGVILSSDCSSRSIADTCYISATFIAACSDIALDVDTRIVNAERGGKLPMTISDYNINLPTLTGCRLEYKQPMESNWHQIQEFGLEEMKTGSVHYTWDMTAIEDGTYEVRAVTICDLGGQKVNNESEEITVIKDVTAPEALGLPSPINGIYTVDNQIYVDFNKNIQTGHITPSCVSVSGVLNAHEQTHSVGVLYDMMPALTQAEYDLSNTSFAFETWLNWSDAGFLLFHTMEGLQLEIMEDARLRVIIDDVYLVSRQTLPKDKWLYLLFNYDLQPDGTGLMSAHCAYDDQTIDLFVNEPLPAYDRRGMLMTGYMLRGKMHDAILWNKSRDWASALGERNTSKDAYTDGILSYWPMDEGEGTVARDIVRHRDLTLISDNMWWYNNGNKALHIPAGAEAVIDFSSFPVLIGGDYMFSFWFRTLAEQETTIFHMANGAEDILLDNDAIIVVAPEGTFRLNMGSRLNDGAWHHCAMSRSHSFSSVILIDGEARNILASQGKNNEASYAICFSDTSSTADLDIDEVCLWAANCSSDYITGLYRNELRGNEPGLQIYFPMQEAVTNSDGETSTRFTLEDKQTNHPERSMRMRVRDSNNDTLDAEQAATVPPIREARPVETVKHTYTASERRIVINITEEARRIEGCTLDVTVENIVDENGNYSTPINWSVYVNRNQMLWDEDNIRVVKDAITDTTFEVTILNNSGKTENWWLYNVPEWLSFDTEGGVLQPLSSKTLTATVSSALSIGNHQQTLYLIGNEGINQPLYLSVKVNAEKPDWQINPADYEYSMNLVAIATVNGHVADDTEDVVAAFIDGELAGIGSPKLFPAHNTYLVMMDVYSNSNTSVPVTFKYWDASTGIIYNRLTVQTDLLDEPRPSLDFLPGQMAGQPNNPVSLVSDKYIEQAVSLAKGWNWISFNVLPENNAFTDILSNIKDSLSIIKSQTAFAQLDEMRRLVGSLQYMEVIKAYKILTDKPYDWTVSGRIPNPAYLGIPLAANGWSWIGYLPQTTLSVDAALANLNPAVGDIVKARSGFATWDGYKWVGSLTAMAPGNGYMYYNSTYQDATLYYPSAGLPLLAPMRVSLNSSLSTLNYFTPIDPSKYQGNMTVTAVVKDGELIVEDAEVGIFAGEECRAAAVQQDGYWFITVPGDKNVELTVQVATGGEVKIVKQTLTYADDAMIGSPVEPYVIQLDEATVIVNVESERIGANKYLQDGTLYIERNGRIYTAQGQLVE